MSKTGITVLILVISVIAVSSCKVTRKVSGFPVPETTGIAGMMERCSSFDTIRSMMIGKSEAILLFQGERYEVTLTLFSEKDSVIYLTAVSSGFEVLRARADKDTAIVIDRMNRVVYRMPFRKMFGYQHPVNFQDLENLVHGVYLCDNMDKATETGEGNILFEFDEQWIRKRVLISGERADIEKFEFFHDKTGEYLMGEKTDEGDRIYSNFVVGEFEIRAGRGERTFNSALEVNMDVNHRKYTFIDLQ